MTVITSQLCIWPGIAVLPVLPVYCPSSVQMYVQLFEERMSTEPSSLLQSVQCLLGCTGSIDPCIFYIIHTRLEDRSEKTSNVLPLLTPLVI